MANNVIHISEAEAASDFASVMAQCELGQRSSSIDSDFAADVEEIIKNRKPRDPPAWE